MPTKGIYTALSGAIAQSKKMDTVANNIANVSTPAYKRDYEVFREYLTAHQKGPDVIAVPKVPASTESFYDMQGGDKGYVDSAGRYTDFTQGKLKVTGSDLDFALQGKGFFEVFTPQGVRFTRNGSFRRDFEGKLVTADGYPVLKVAPPGAAPETRIIQLGNAKLSASNKGDLVQNGQEVARLSVIDVGNVDALQKVGQSMYMVRPNIEPELAIAEDFDLRQGVQELSNVNIVQEMTNLIATSRVFESTQKAIKAYDQMNQRLVNDVPKLG